MYKQIYNHFNRYNYSRRDKIEASRVDSDDLGSVTQEAHLRNQISFPSWTFKIRRVAFSGTQRENARDILFHASSMARYGDDELTDIYLRGMSTQSQANCSSLCHSHHWHSKPDARLAASHRENACAIRILFHALSMARYAWYERRAYW